MVALALGMAAAAETLSGHEGETKLEGQLRYNNRCTLVYDGGHMYEQGNWADVVAKMKRDGGIEEEIKLNEKMQSPVFWLYDDCLYYFGGERIAECNIYERDLMRGTERKISDIFFTESK